MYCRLISILTFDEAIRQTSSKSEGNTMTSNRIRDNYHSMTHNIIVASEFKTVKYGIGRFI